MSPGAVTPPNSLLVRVPFVVWTLVCGMLWGSAFPVIKLVFEHWSAQGIEIDFATRSYFAGVRFSIAGAALLLLARQPLAEWRATPRRYIFAMTATQTVAQYVCFYLGLSLSSGALASLLVSSGSLWWVLLAPIFLKTAHLTGRQWFVLAIGAVGVSLAVYAPGISDGSPRIGAVLILAANLFGALGLVSFQFVKHTMGSRAGTGYSLFLGGLVLVGLGLQMIGQTAMLFDPYVIGLTLWLAFVSAAGFSLWNQLSTIYSVHTLATYRFLVPLCGVVESLILLDGERLTIPMMIGGVLVLGAMTQAQGSPARTTDSAAGKTASK
jgi:drug/metabolite transporter (DMT)-like permease